MQTKRISWMTGTLLACGLVATATAQNNAASADEGVKVGQQAPDFTLKGVDGKTYKLSDHTDKIVVLEWFNQDCPYSHKYDSGFAAGKRAAKLAHEMKKKGVVWLAIDTTHYQTAEKNKELAEKNKLPYPILMDGDGKVGRMYGAKTTPHMFVIQEGKVVYAGAFDNDARGSRSGDDVRSYVKEALEAVMAGKDVPVDSVKPWGCSVKYAKKAD